MVSTGERTPPATAEPPPGGHPAWRHAVEVGPVLAGAVFAAGTVAAAFAVPLAPAAVVAFAAAVSIGVAAVVTTRSRAVAAHIAACGTVAAGWLVYAIAAGPWTWTAVAALAAPAAVLIPAWPAARARQARVAEAERAILAAAAAEANHRRWPDLLAKVGFKGVTWASQDATLCGYSVRLRLPDSGRVTYTGLASAREKLEVAARARHGSLRFERGGQAHEVILHVAERDVLAETIPLPIETRRLTINEPIPVGLFEDGSTCTLNLREVATLIVGIRGSGKSNLLRVLLAQLARCVDVLVFVIDLKGGRMAAPWLAPWLEGHVQAPCIDWLATTRDEAEVMLRACLAGIDARSRSGSGGEKIRPSATQPAVLLITDEAAVIFGQGTGGPRSSLDGTTNAALASLATQLTITGRSEAIDPVFAVQRGTVSMVGSGDLKSQCSLRIGLGVATEADARSVIPDDVHIAGDLARLSHPGSGIVQVKQGRAMPVKFFRLEHDEVGPIARLNGRLRPAPDRVLREALGPEYETRWTERGGYLVPPAAPSPVVTPPGRTTDEFEAIVASLDDVDDAVVADDANPARQAMRAYLRRMAPRPVTPGMIVDRVQAEHLPVSRQTVHRWLNEDAAAGLVQQGRRGQWRWK
jgi:hypothetical protein